MPAYISHLFSLVYFSTVDLYTLSYNGPFVLFSMFFCNKVEIWWLPIFNCIYHNPEKKCISTIATILTFMVITHMFIFFINKNCSESKNTFKIYVSHLHPHPQEYDPILQHDVWPHQDSPPHS